MYTLLGSHMAPRITLYSQLVKNSQLGKIFFVTSTFVVYTSKALKILRLKMNLLLKLPKIQRLLTLDTENSGCIKKLTVAIR